MKRELKEKEINKTDHQIEIENSRIGGFGGSDAAMFLKIGQYGIESLSESDKRRISVAKGEIPYKSVYQTEAMRRGHEFEDWAADHIFIKGNNFREFLIEKDLTKKFKTFAHADFLFSTDVYTEVTECKCLMNPERAIRDYEAQLNWYYMLGVDHVNLCTINSKLEFDIKNVKIYPVIENIPVINLLKKGIQVLSENWETIELPSICEDYDISDMLEFEQDQIEEYSDILTKIKQLEERAAVCKTNILQIFSDNNIKTLRSEYYTFSYVAPSFRSSLDKDAFEKAHPEINLSKFNKSTAVGASIKFTLKKQK